MYTQTHENTRLTNIKHEHSYKNHVYYLFWRRFAQQAKPMRRVRVRMFYVLYKRVCVDEKKWATWWFSHLLSHNKTHTNWQWWFVYSHLLDYNRTFRIFRCSRNDSLWFRLDHLSLCLSTVCIFFCFVSVFCCCSWTEITFVMKLWIYQQIRGERSLYDFRFILFYKDVWCRIFAYFFLIKVHALTLVH